MTKARVEAGGAAKRADGAAKRSGGAAKRSDGAVKRSDGAVKRSDDAAKRSDEAAKPSDGPAKRQSANEHISPQRLAEIKSLREAVRRLRDDVSQARAALVDLQGQLVAKDQVIVRSHADLEFLSRSILELKNSRSWRLTAPIRSSKIGLRSARDFIRKLMKGAVRVADPVGSNSGHERPHVSIIVPNFNHDRFLARRLSSIYNQSYSNFDVILLDDCSVDGSRETLTAFADRYPSNTRVVFNSENSGSPFKQWVKGIDLAKGPLVWIAESDDLCNLNFLEEVVKGFQKESVLLAYADIQYIDENDDIRHGLDDYRRSTGYDKWQAPYLSPSVEDFRGPFSRRNIIPNVSGAVFRKPHLTEEIINEVGSYRICGDWVLYSFLARGGDIYYTPATRSYFRQHTSNTSVSGAADMGYYREHHRVARYVSSLYVPDGPSKESFLDGIRATFRHRHGDNPPFELNEFVDTSSFAPNRSRLNILIVSLGFFSGGGEMLPLNLANALHRMGESVTFLSLGDYGDEETSIRRLLDTDIPVLRRADIAADPDFIRTYEIDIINSHNLAVEYLFKEIGFARKHGASYVVTHHGSYEVSDAPDEDLRDFEQLVDHWIYLSEKNLSRLRLAGVDVDQSTKFPNGVPVAAKISRDEISLPPGAFVCVLVSRALREKGWAHSVAAVEAARARTGMDIHLLLVGNGPEYDRMKKEGVASFIHLFGFRADGASFYQYADVGLLPSFFPGESFPLTLIECLQAGKPCIATDIGEIRSMLSNDSGLLAGRVVAQRKTDDTLIADLTDAISAMAERGSGYQLAAEVATEIAIQYRIENVASRYREMFHKLRAH